MDDERKLTPVRHPARSNTNEFYGRCTIDELHGFFESRRRVQVPRPSRQACLVMLKQLDKVATFRLLALPKDIRLIVYDEILLFDNEHERTLCPQILATCRQVYEEAVQTFRKNFETTTVVRVNYAEDNGGDKAAGRTQGPSGVFVPRTCWYDTSTLVTETPGPVQHGSWSQLLHTRKDYGLLRSQVPPEIRDKEHMLVYLRLDADVDHVRTRIWQHLDALVELINAKNSKIRRVDIRVHHMRGGLMNCDIWLSLLQELATCAHFSIEISLQGLPKVCSGPPSCCRCRGSVIDTLQRWRVDQYRYQKYGLA